MISDLRVMRSVWIKADHCKIITDKSDKSDSYLGTDNGKGTNFSQIRTLND